MDELDYLKNLAGINEFKGYTEYNPRSVEDMSQAASENRQQEKEKGIKPGDKEWFELWFSSPASGSLNNVPSFRGRNK